MKSSSSTRLFRWGLPLALVGMVAAWPLLGSHAREQPGPQATPIPKFDPKVVTLTPADAAAQAKEARDGVSVEMPPGVELKLFASDSLVTDPIALEFDHAGTLYVTSSSRNNLPLDIRQHPTWVPVVHTLKTVADLRNFFHRELAPEKSQDNPWLADLNKDGSNDYRDFTEVKERIYRIQDTNGDGIADRSNMMIEGFNDDPVIDIAGGLLREGGDLIVGVAPGIYRLRDENGDGIIDSQSTISEGFGVHYAFGGHGISGVTQGPDGRIYWEVGDIGYDVTDKSGRRWSKHNQGGVFRSEPDGSGFEVFATGIRNLQEFAFDEYGNLISVDNDGDHQGETERLVYIPEGSDGGWRSNWQYGKYTDPANNRYNVWMDEQMFKPRFAGQAAHILPPIAPYHAGPSGMVYNPGTALSDEWHRTFFVTSFPGAPANARVYGFTLKEDGAGFALESDKVVLRGVLAVGLKFGADGALYLADWITGWDSKNKGRIWTLDTPATAASAPRAEVKSLLSKPFHGRPASELSTLLRHADMRVRQQAQFELVRVGDVASLRAAARDADNRLARIHGIWGIAQLARRQPAHAALLTPLLADADAEIRAQAAKMAGDLKFAGAAPQLLGLLKDPAPRPRFFAAEALGRLAHKPAVAPLVDMLNANDDQDVFLRHAGSLALSRTGEPGELAALASHRSRGVRLAALVALRRLQNAEVARFLTDDDETVVLEAARAINDDGGIAGGVAALSKMLAGQSTNAALLRRAINANLKSGSPDALARLTAFAADVARPEPMRVEAVGVLGVWAAPSPLDRVDGYYIGQPAARDGAAAAAAVLKLLESQAGAVAGSTSPAMRIALADAAGRLRVAGAAPLLRAQLQKDPEAGVRVASLRALQALKLENMDEVMNVAVKDTAPEVRRAALAILPTLPLSDAAKAEALAAVIRGGSVQDQQGGFEVLGTLKSPEANTLLGAFLDELIAGTIAPAVQLDLVDAVEASESAPLAARLEAYRTSKGAESMIAAFRDALLVGGSGARGRELFVEHAAAQCTRCHTVRSAGSDVGPNLTRIGATLKREQLLESLLEPNVRVAPGFGIVSLTLKSGAKVDGTLRDETASEVVVMAGTPPVEQRIAKTEIAARTDPVSAMPPMGALLKPRDVRDLVEYLSSLR